MQRKGDINKYFIDNLKQLRWENNLTQKELAEKVGISKSSIGFYENGDRIPDINTLSAIADYFNVSTDFLLGRTDIKTLDFNVREISEQTGLSELAVERIMIQNDISPGFEMEPIFRKSLYDEEIEFCHFDMKDVVNKAFEEEALWDLLERIRVFLHASEEKSYLKLKYICALDRELDDFTESEILELQDFGRVSKCINEYDLSLFKCEQGLRNLLSHMQYLFNVEPENGNFSKLYKLVNSMIEEKKESNSSVEKAGDPDGNDQKEE